MVVHSSVPKCSLKTNAEDLRLGFGYASGQLQL